MREGLLILSGSCITAFKTSGPSRSSTIDPERARNGFEECLHGEKPKSQDGKANQRWNAPAWQHTVIDLHHEKRAGQHQDIDNTTEDEDAIKSGFQRLDNEIKVVGLARRLE
jgi:hypothetical protein